MTADTADRELLRATLDVWHPDCWGIESSEQTGACVVGHGAATDGRSAYEHCTIYGDSADNLEQAVEAAYDSSFITAIDDLGDCRRATLDTPAIGQAARDVFIEYEATDGVGAAFVSRGFVLDSHYEVRAGRETWNLLVRTTRDEFGRTVDAVSEALDADITLDRLAPAEQAPPPERPDPHAQVLTPRQQEALALARRRGYYSWPREVTTRELAKDLGVSKTTFLEHLRRAEATLLGPSDGPK
ncbi:helix-turn-helix domain-containing protein [Haloarchaeobius sp. DFWS5]|uniref:helix-turn-helix domain-containing protein n=1 Tax=Haloarchaeobius sp. DFWS5 TaxID=3446114 RepID=UPI003EBFA66D